MEHKETLVMLDALMRFGINTIWIAITIYTVAQIGKALGWTFIKLEGKK